MTSPVRIATPLNDGESPVAVAPLKALQLDAVAAVRGRRRCAGRPRAATETSPIAVPMALSSSRACCASWGPLRVGGEWIGVTLGRASAHSTYHLYQKITAVTPHNS